MEEAEHLLNLKEQQIANELLTNRDQRRKPLVPLRRSTVAIDTRPMMRTSISMLTRSLNTPKRHRCPRLRVIRSRLMTVYI